MKRIHITESQLLTESYYPEAGTDFPRFYDEKTDTWYEAQWNGDYGFPFGFWPTDWEGYNEVFSVGDAWSTHENACGKVAREYYSDILYEQVGEDVSAIVESVNEIMSNIKEYGYEWNSDSEVWVSPDGDEIDLWDEADNLVGDLRFVTDYNIVHDIIVEAIENGGNIDESALSEDIMDRTFNDQDFTNRDGIDRALESIGDNFQSFFERGNSEGRIWPEKKMIGFYQTEQPDPQHLLYILGLLSKHDEIGVDYDDLLNFHMVFEDWRNDGQITACTLSDYIDGNYGPDSYEDEEENEIQYARDGKTQFVPHLANQDQKREFFKGFRDTRDQAVYVPREKGVGSLARYHAMRYPDGENKKKLAKIIKEEINKILELSDIYIKNTHKNYGYISKKI